MNRISTKKIRFFQDQILHWYKFNKRNFYWRSNGLSSYEYVIAEVLLQRTKAETIAKFYPEFINEFCSWESLATASLEKIELYLRPIGLYSQRSVRLKSLAIEMVKRKGILPKNRKELESIPFIGQYIANAVELVIFNKESPLVDVNMARVLERFFGERKMVDIRYDPYLQDLSYKIVRHENTKKINWAILDFAAIICKAIKPKCKICPLNEKCNYFNSLL